MGLLGVSIITCAVLYGLLAAILVVVLFLANVPIWISFAIVIAVIIVQFLVAPFLTDLMQRWFYKTDFNAPIPSYLEEFIRETCEANGVKYPKIGIINDGAPNAFTYGRTKKDARIVLTEGIFDLLDEDEVKAVVAHEIGHIAHYDMAIMTMVQIVPMVLYMVYTMLLPRGGSSNKDSGAQALIAIVALILYVICQYIILWLSRVREYYADEFSAQVTNNPNALTSALVNIGFGLSTREKKNKDAKGSASGQSTLGIFDSKNSKSMVVNCYNNGEIDKDRIKNAMKWELWNTWAFWYELGSTHPLTSKRIFRLDKLAEQRGQEAFVKFDLQKPESYADDFARELIILIMPWLGALAAGVAGYFLLRNTFADYFSLCLVLGGIVLGVGVVLSCLKYLFTHPRQGYYEANTAGLLSEVKVSMVRSIPAELKGIIIGRGNPGCIFNEDFVLQDETGILFLDYNQPMWIINKIFALFKSPEYFNKVVTVKGWYRRNMVPFMELYAIEIDGQTKKCFTYGFGWGWRIAMLVIAVGLIAAGFVL